MNQFLKKLGLFFILLILGTFWLGKLQPIYYGNPDYSFKLDFYRNHKKEIKTVFFGSSRTYRHVDPSVIDSSNKALAPSFNMGTAATFNPENYFLFEKFLQEADTNLKYAFLEILPLGEIAPKNMVRAKNCYFIDGDILKYSLNYLSNDKSTILKTITASSLYVGSYITNQFYPQGLNIHYIEKPIRVLGNSHNGYFSLSFDTLAKIRQLGSNSDTSFNQKRITAASTKMIEFSGYLNSTHLNKLKDLRAKAKAKGIILKFIIPPRLLDYKSLLALKQTMPEDVLNLGDYNSYPEFYDISLLFDEGHFNARGAKIYSMRLAAAIHHILENKRTAN